MQEGVHGGEPRHFQFVVYERRLVISSLARRTEFFVKGAERSIAFTVEAGYRSMVASTVPCGSSIGTKM